MVLRSSSGVAEVMTILGCDRAWFPPLSGSKLENARVAARIRSAGVEASESVVLRGVELGVLATNSGEAADSAMIGLFDSIDGETLGLEKLGPVVWGL